MSKRKADNPADAPEAKKARIDRVLYFLDLGSRRGMPATPKVFGEMSEVKWNALDAQLAEEYPEVHMDFGDIECDVKRENFKMVIKENEEPARFEQMRAIFAETLGQRLDGHSFQFTLS
jgi:hypothetical protein